MNTAETDTVIAFTGRIAAVLHLLRMLPMDLPAPLSLVTTSTHSPLPVVSWGVDNTADALRILAAMPGNWEVAVDDERDDGHTVSCASINMRGVHVHVVVSGHDLLEDYDAVTQLQADLDAWNGATA